MRKRGGASARCFTGHELGIGPWGTLVPTNDEAVDTIDASLKAVLRAGHPTPDKALGEALLSLRGVVARSIHPDDRISRADAFNELLPRLIETIIDDFDRPATQILFGVSEGSRGIKLTTRRAKAAALRSYDDDHFRQNIEPRLRREVALLLHRDSLRYKSRSRRAPAAMEPTGDTPKIRPDDFTAQEELVSRIWAEVYALRAELIAAGRKRAQPEYAPQVAEHELAARAAGKRLESMLQEYVDTYGERFIKHGNNEFDVDGLKRLFAWSM